MSAPQTKRPHVVVIDPAMRKPELEALNLMALASPLPLTYHLPALFGLESLAAEDLASARGVVVMGSAASVHDRHDWQGRLEEWLRPLLAKGMPTFGICYGHQMLAYMFGGKVAYAFPDQKKHVGLRTVDVDGTPCWAKATGELAVSHNEIVVEVPSEMKITARSPDVAVEGLAHKTLPIFSFQPHPEAAPTFLAARGFVPSEPMQRLSFGHGLVAGFLRFCAEG
jgi:GMP synthase (glutamine-hydrolysing)